jgi:23S rRNA pseudouridine1911/1915/1917 synthase
VGESGLFFFTPAGHGIPRELMSKTLLDWLAVQYPTAKRETLRRMFRDGRVTVNGARPANLKTQIGTNDQVAVSDRRPPPRAMHSRLPFRIVHEDEDVLIVDKPPGLLTSTVAREKRPTLLAAVRTYVLSREPRARVGLIHRLARDACGVLVLSISDEAYQSLKSQFFHHRVTREYLAITEGIPSPREGRIVSWLLERADGTVYSTRESRRGERAVTHFQVIETSKARALVRVRLETGRKHQIRVHLAQRKTPIVGDSVYGGKKDAPRLMLIAVKLGFEHPRTGKTVEFELQPPKEFQASL